MRGLVVVALVACTASLAGCQGIELVEDSGDVLCPGHWHAGFDVYVQDDNGTPKRMSFRYPDFDLSGQTPPRAHMHQRDGKNQWHFEQEGKCVGVQEALSYVDVDLTASSMTLHDHHAELGQAGAYTATGSAPITVYVEHASDRTFEWRRHSLSSILDDQLKDGERLLILYGQYSADEVAAFQQHVPVPSTGRAAPAF